jgi:glycosyltransferase involved in cell wall biosynthesis
MTANGTHPSTPIRSEAQPTPVMHLIHTIAYGGVETAVLNWLGALDRTRYIPHLVCFSTPEGSERPFMDAARRAGFAVETIPWRRSKPVLQASQMLGRLMRDREIRILHTHNTYADLVGLVAARSFRVRTITTLYVWSSLGWKRNLLQRFNRMMLPFFDLVSAHCEITYDQSLAFGVRPEKLRLLICGFDVSPYNGSKDERVRLRSELGIDPDDPVLINVARLYPEKEQKWLLELFHEVRQQHPRAKLLIAGIGPLEAELRAASAALGLDDSVIFLGFRKDLPALLSVADIHVNSSSAEGVPLAICSAMAAGLPIVATEVGGLPEILNHGKAGVLVPFQSNEKFVSAVLDLIGSPERRKAYGSAARRFISEDYSLNTAVQRLQKTYDELLIQ